MIKCVIIDDEPLAITVLENYIPKAPQLHLVGKTTNPIEGLEMIRSLKADLVFLDIQMDEMSGLEVAALLPPETKVIFCTAFEEFAVQTYNMEAVDYLLKPIALPRFLKAIDRASNIILGHSIKKLKEIPNDYIFIKGDQKGKMVKLNFCEIEYVEGMKNYVAFYTARNKIMTHLTMKDVDNRLSKNNFIRVHKSYIVSIQHIVTIENSCIFLANRENAIPLSESYKAEFLDRVKGNLFF